MARAVAHLGGVWTRTCSGVGGITLFSSCSSLGVLLGYSCSSDPASMILGQVTCHVATFLTIVVLVSPVGNLHVVQSRVGGVVLAVAPYFTIPEAISS